MNQNKTFFSQQALSGIPWVVTSKSLLFIVYFIISVVTVRHLGAENYGIYVICKSISEVLILVCTLGMTASFMRFIPELILEKNKAGIKRLILKASCLQFSALVLALSCLLFFSESLARYLGANLDGVLFFTCLLIVFELFKTNINAVLTSLYHTKTLAIFSTIHGALWLLLLASLLYVEPSVPNALLAPSLSYALIYTLAAFTIIAYFKSLNWKSPDRAIGRGRVLNHSGSVALSTLVRLLMLKYTELFFLAGQHDAATVGMYDLAFSLPLMVIVFIPAAIQDLFVSGFSEAYVKDHHCLPILIRAFYKLVILLTVPMAVFGFYFSADFLSFAYGAEVNEAGELITFFCLLHLLPLISMPLSMAIQAKEKVINTLPTLLLQLGVNLILDYLFIVEWQWGVWGAITAVLLTFIMTIPVRLYVVKRILGGIYFPLGFFIRVFGLCLIIGLLFKYNSPSPELLSLVLFIPCYFLLILVLLKPCHILKKVDRDDLNKLMQGRAQKLINKFNQLVHFTRQKTNLLKAQENN